MPLISDDVDLSKKAQCRGKKEKKKNKKNDNAYSILQKAWKVQSEGLRKKGRCEACGSDKNLCAGHLVHGGRGKAFNLVDFNVNLPSKNIFCQCGYCNTYDPNGNGKLLAYYLSIGNTLNDYNDLKSIKQKVWKPTEEDAMQVLTLTEMLYK